MDIKKPQLVKVEAFAYFFVGSSATPSINRDTYTYRLTYLRHVPYFGTQNQFFRDSGINRPRRGLAYSSSAVKGTKSSSGGRRKTARMAWRISAA